MRTEEREGGKVGGGGGGVGGGRDCWNAHAQQRLFVVVIRNGGVGETLPHWHKALDEHDGVRAGFRRKLPLEL